MSNATAPVLIVGAGPTGLALALALLQNGIVPRIIQKDLQFRVGQKGSGLMPRTQEMYHLLGVIRDLQYIGGRVQDMRMYTHGDTVPMKTYEFVGYSADTPSSPYMNGLMVGQDRHEEILRTHLAKFGCTVELGTKLQSLKQYPDHVEVELIKRTEDGKEDIVERSQFSWVIGADGGHSVVRQQLGLSFLGETRDNTQWVVGDIHVKNGVSRDFWHIWGDQTTKFFALRPFEIPGDDRFSFVAAGPQFDHAKVASSREEVINAFYETSGWTDVEFGETTWISNFKPNIRMVDSFGIGRVFVAGDAAHCHSPTGGQGMNSSVQDSVNLAWKLALVQRGFAPQSLLESYTKERLPVIAAMLDKTTKLLNKIHQEEGWTRGTELLQLGVNYRGSPIVVDESPSATPDEEIDPYRSGDAGSALRAGDRAPDAPAILSVHGPGAQRLFDLFKPDRHTVLIFDAGLQREVVESVKDYPSGTIVTAAVIPVGSTFEHSSGSPDYIFQDLKGFASQNYETEANLKVVIVRPDMFIGAVVGGKEGIQKYFNGIFLDKATSTAATNYNSNAL